MTMAPSASPVRRAAGHRVRVDDRGTGRPLLLINGLGAPLELWEPLRRALGGRRTVGYDPPGVGGSPVGAPPLSMAGHARVALGVLDALGEEVADVLGFSFGGMVAQELARLAPGRVRRLVLAGTSCGWGGVPGSPLAVAAVGTPARYYSGRAFAASAPLFVGGREAADPEFLAGQQRVRTAHPPSWQGYAAQLAAALGWSSLGWLGRLSVPALVLAGADDPLVPAANAALLAALLGSARSVVVPAGGHLFLLDRAGEVATLVDTFLSG